MGSRRGSRGPGRPSPRTKVSPGMHQAAVSAPERHPQPRVPTWRRSTEIKTGTSWQTPARTVSSNNGWYPDWSNSHRVTASTGSGLQCRIPPGSKARRGRVPVLDTSGHGTQTQPREERGSMRGQVAHNSGTSVHGHRMGGDEGGWRTHAAAGMQHMQSRRSCSRLQAAHGQAPLLHCAGPWAPKARCW